MRRLNKKGFTLVEIMIVVAIIILLAAIAIPNLLRARLNANEAAAIGACRTVSTAAESFRAGQTTPSYPASLAVLATSVPPYIDTVLGTGVKSGYSFDYDSTSGGDAYTCVATPTTVNVTGVRTFFVDGSGVVRVGNTSAGTPIQ